MSKQKKKKTAQQTYSSIVRQFCVIVFVLLCALAICCGTLSIRFYGDGWETEGTIAPILTLDPSDAEVTLVPVTVESADTEQTSVPETIAPETTVPKVPETIAPETTAPETTSPPIPETTAPFNDDPAALTARPLPVLPEPEPPVEIDVRVPESTAVDASYFQDAVFIGDSRTVGLSLYSGLKSNYYSQQGLNVSSVMKNAFIPAGEQKLTLSEALDANPGFTKVYISFGINEIGWNTTASFVDTYATLVDLVREKLPNAVIYIQEILPMYKATAENDRYRPMGGNDKVAEYNGKLYELCWEKGLYYIALTEIFADENGDLNVQDSGDGIHLGVSSSKAWIEYLKTHTVSDVET